MTTVTTTIELDAERERDFLSGEIPTNYGLIEKALGVRISVRGDKIIVQGEQTSLDNAMSLFSELRKLNQSGYRVKRDEVRHALRAFSEGTDGALSDLIRHSISVSPRKASIIPKTKNQIEYVEAIRTHDMVIGIGPAGTGKTYLAMAMAINALLNKQVSRVVLARPAVEAGEKLGFLPGDIAEKVTPYLRPLYDALYDMLELEKATALIEKGVIEIAPLAFMRGRTLNDSFIILDEAQNTTTEQMKMYLTRLGFNSKTVITGDETQIDLPAGKLSGLVEAQRVLKNVEGIKFIHFSERDVVRHKLVQRIVRAYEHYQRDTQTD